MSTADDQIDTGPLERSQQAIDEARDAVKGALQDTEPDPDLDMPATGEGLESDEQDVAPRPN